MYIVIQLYWYTGVIYIVIFCLTRLFKSGGKQKSEFVFVI